MLKIKSFLFTLFSFVILTGATLANNCPDLTTEECRATPGCVHNGTNCSTCTMGSFCENGIKTSCDDATNGSHPLSDFGATSIFECYVNEECSPGYNWTGEYCLICPRGYYCPDKEVSGRSYYRMNPCPAGHSTRLPGRTGFKDCILIKGESRLCDNNTCFDL